MSWDIPFLRPNLVPRKAYQDYLESIDDSHLYSNNGPLNALFESRVLAEQFQGRGAATTVANATLGLMLAISEVKRPGARYALMPSFTFAACPLAAQWCGLEPYFLDVNPDTWCMDLEELDRALALLGDEVAVVLPYATFGTVLDLTPYKGIHLRGIPVVVDAAPGFGAEDSIGHIGLGFPGLVVFSFHATKAFGVGEGGLVYSADPDLLSRIRTAGNFGFSPARESAQLGLNSKMSEYAAAICLATLDGFPGKLAERQRIHAWYLEALDAQCQGQAGWGRQVYCGSVPWQFMSVLCPDGTRDARRDRMLGLGIECKTYFDPSCHHHPQFLGCRRGSLQATEGLSRRILSLPLWEGMERGDVVRVVQGLVG
jgi:dTDP-4-amino-4,6-dideoxygalactose transaminase